MPSHGARDVLADITSTSKATSEAAYKLLISFLMERSPERALTIWFGAGLAQGPGEVERLERLLVRDIATIDELLSDQVDAILHHPRLQRIEASWRGLLWLVEEVSKAPEAGSPPIKVRVLDLS